MMMLMTAITYRAFPACMSDCVSNSSRALLHSILAGNLGDRCSYSHFPMRKPRNLSDVKLLMQGHKARMWQREQWRLALWGGRACTLRHCVLVLLGGRRLLLLTAGEAWWHGKCPGFVMVTRKANIQNITVMIWHRRASALCKTWCKAPYCH